MDYKNNQISEQDSKSFDIRKRLKYVKKSGLFVISIMFTMTCIPL